jgi:hypothetical protein
VPGPLAAGLCWIVFNFGPTLARPMSSSSSEPVLQVRARQPERHPSLTGWTGTTRRPGPSPIDYFQARTDPGTVTLRSSRGAAAAAAPGVSRGVRRPGPGPPLACHESPRERRALSESVPTAAGLASDRRAAGPGRLGGPCSDLDACRHPDSDIVEYRHARRVHFKSRQGGARDSDLCRDGPASP